MADILFMLALLVVALLYLHNEDAFVLTYRHVSARLFPKSRRRWR